MKSFKEIAEAYEVELLEKKMKPADLKKNAKALKKRKKTPEYKKDMKIKKKCEGKIKPGQKKSCGMGDTTPTKIDKSRAKAAKKGSKSR